MLAGSVSLLRDRTQAIPASQLLPRSSRSRYHDQEDLVAMLQETDASGLVRKESHVTFQAVTDMPYWTMNSSTVRRP